MSDLAWLLVGLCSAWLLWQWFTNDVGDDEW